MVPQWEFAKNDKRKKFSTIWLNKNFFFPWVVVLIFTVGEGSDVFDEG
jgi:hypothetical protein